MFLAALLPAVSNTACLWLLFSQQLLSGTGGVWVAVDLSPVPPGASPGHRSSESGRVTLGC